MDLPPPPAGNFNARTSSKPVPAPIATNSRQADRAAKEKERAARRAERKKGGWANRKKRGEATVDRKQKASSLSGPQVVPSPATPSLTSTDLPPRKPMPGMEQLGNSVPSSPSMPKVENSATDGPMPPKPVPQANGNANGHSETNGQAPMHVLPTMPPMPSPFTASPSKAGGFAARMPPPMVMSDDDDMNAPSNAFPTSKPLSVTPVAAASTVKSSNPMPFQPPVPQSDSSMPPLPTNQGNSPAAQNPPNNVQPPEKTIVTKPSKQESPEKSAKPVKTVPAMKEVEAAKPVANVARPMPSPQPQSVGGMMPKAMSHAGHFVAPVPATDTSTIRPPVTPKEKLKEEPARDAHPPMNVTPELKHNVQATTSSVDNMAKGPLLKFRNVSQEEIDEFFESRRPVPYTIFCVEWLKNGIVLCGGGGGGSGMGVTSGVTCCRVEMVAPEAGAQKVPVLVPVGKLSSNDIIVLKMTSHPRLPHVAMAIGNRTHAFELRNQFDLVHMNSVQTDFNTDSFTGVVQFSRGGALLATGGDDKLITILQYPSLKPALTLGKNMKEKHTDQLVDIHFNETDAYLASAAGTTKLKVWALKSTDGKATPGALLSDIAYEEGKAKYKFGACRFVSLPKHSAPEGKNPGEYLYALANASARGPGYIFQFKVGTWELVQRVKITEKVLTSLEVNKVDSGENTMLTVSNNKGEVFIYSTPMLQQMHVEKDCHSLPTTGVCFAPDSKYAVSVSADKSIHFTPTRPSSGGGDVGGFLLLLLHMLLVAGIVVYVLYGKELSASEIMAVLHKSLQALSRL